jgi:hypothetical protein
MTFDELLDEFEIFELEFDDEWNWFKEGIWQEYCEMRELEDYPQ